VSHFVEAQGIPDVIQASETDVLNRLQLIDIKFLFLYKRIAGMIAVWSNKYYLLEDVNDIR